MEFDSKVFPQIDRFVDEYGSHDVRLTKLLDDIRGQRDFLLSLTRKMKDLPSDMDLESFVKQSAHTVPFRPFSVAAEMQVFMSVVKNYADYAKCLGPADYDHSVNWWDEVMS